MWDEAKSPSLRPLLVEGIAQLFPLRSTVQAARRRPPRKAADQLFRKNIRRKRGLVCKKVVRFSEVRPPKAEVKSPHKASINTRAASWRVQELAWGWPALGSGRERGNPAPPPTCGARPCSCRHWRPCGWGHPAQGTLPEAPLPPRRPRRATRTTPHPRPCGWWTRSRLTWCGGSSSSSSPASTRATPAGASSPPLSSRWNSARTCRGTRSWRGTIQWQRKIFIFLTI